MKYTAEQEAKKNSCWIQARDPERGILVHIPAHDLVSFRWWAYSPTTPAETKEKYSLVGMTEELVEDGGAFYWLGKKLSEAEKNNFPSKWTIRAV